MNNKMCTCKACGQEIAKSAKSCPHCGAKNKKAKPVLAVLVAFVALIIIIGVAGGNDEPVKVGQVEPQTTTIATQAEKNTFSIGEIAELRNVQVSLISVTESAGSSFNTPNEGNVFVLCEFEITNNSQEEIAVSSMLSFEAYCDDYACAYSLSAMMEKGNKNQLDGTVAAGKKMNGVIGYEVAESWSEIEVHFVPDFWSGKDIIFTATNN